MTALKTAADVLGVAIDAAGNSDGATVVINWGGRRVEYVVGVLADVVTENLYVAVVKFPGYVRGLLVVDRRAERERVQLHLYDGSKVKVKDVAKNDLAATFAAASPFMTSSNELMGGMWYPVAWSLSIAA